MTRYKFLRLDHYRRVIETLQFDCESDESALAHAMAIADQNALELWRGNQKLAFIAAGIFSIKNAAAGTDISGCRPVEEE